MSGASGGLACAALGFALLSACSTAPEADIPAAADGIRVEGFVIRNELAYPVTDVMVDVPATGRFAGCGNILPRSECRNTFQQIDYRRNAVAISWSEYGEPHRTEEFVVELPDGVVPGDVLVLEVIVFAPGQAGARLRAVGADGLRSR